MPSHTPPWLTAAQDTILTEQAHRYAAMLVANHDLGSLDALEVLLTGLADRPDLVPGVVTRLLNQIGGDPDGAE